MRQRGLTLVEMMIAVAIVAVLAMVALPSFTGMAERARLRQAAETLASDFGEARFEAARSGRPLHVAMDATTPAWCWNVAVAPGCGCQVAAGCQLKTARARDHAGIRMSDAHGAVFAPEGIMQVVGGATFHSSRGETLRVAVGPMGRASVCSPDRSVAGYPAC